MPPQPPRIFISYSRVDTPFAERFVRILQRMVRGAVIFYDVDSLYAGDLWWDEILSAIETCDLFIYLLSNESVISPYCQAEFNYARQLRKLIITVQVRDRTTLSGELGEIQYVNMAYGMDNAEAVAGLSGAINKQLALPKRTPISKKRPAKPGVVQ